MNSHLRVVIDGHDVALKADAMLEVTDSNPYLNDGVETYSYNFELPIDENRELLGNIDHPQSGRRLTALEGKPMQIYVDGILFRSGKVAVVDDQDIKETVSISMTSSKKQLGDMIGDMNLRDIQFPESDKENLKIGEKIGDIAISSVASGDSVMQLHAVFRAKSPKGFERPNRFDVYTSYNTSYSEQRKIQPQALGFSSPKEFYLDADGNVRTDRDGKPRPRKSFINVSTPYGETISQPDGSLRTALYHNARISYIHHAVDVDNKTTDEVIYESKAYGPYYVLDADRPQSGICFYLMYVLKSLFGQLGVAYSEDVLSKIQDFKHLSFFTTRCKYDVENKPATTLSEKVYFGYEDDLHSANQWLSQRNTGGELKPGFEDTDPYEANSAQHYRFPVYTDIYVYKLDNRPTGSEWVALAAAHGEYYYARKTDVQEMDVRCDTEVDVRVHNHSDETPHTDVITYSCIGVMYASGTLGYKYSAAVQNMYANADNLPEMSVESMLKSLWGSFGLRFHYDSESNVVEPYFIRDVLRDTDAPWEVFGEHTEEYPMSEKITGVTMKYSAESDLQQQLLNVRKGVTDYDTTYDYLMQEMPVEDIVTDRRYDQFSQGFLSVGDYHCYIDMQTAKAYRVKINKDEIDAGNISSLSPVLFQVAQFKGITVYADEVKSKTQAEKLESDVTDHIEEIVSEFQPLVQNDVNFGRKNGVQLLSPFADADMYNENSEMDAIRNVVDSNELGVFYIDEVITGPERYAMTESGNSPLQDIDWGNCITLMRGGGNDAGIQHFAPDYDYFSNERWRRVAGTAQMDSDCLTDYNETYDYNTGSIEGDGGGERISLTIRAYQVDKNGRKLYDESAKDNALRGLADRFMSEYIYFLLHRKKMGIKMLCEISYLLNIPWKRRFKIGQNIGWIDSIHTKISIEKGIEEVEFTMFVL